MKKIAICFILAAIAISGYSQTESKLVKWYTIEEALKLNEQNPKKIFIDVYTDWCGWCKTMDKNTFNQPQIAEYLNKYYYPVKLNAEQKEDITYKGKVFKNNNEGTRSAHDFAAALLSGKLSYPSVVYMDGENNLLTAVPGYTPPTDIEPILVFFGEDHYKTTKWEDFKSKFVSKLKK
ncbi:MAG TPA: thioredoxin [Bacteroidales bacterium]|nr:thioredoxin [Bacteroidales bacterium]